MKHRRIVFIPAIQRETKASLDKDEAIAVSGQLIDVYSESAVSDTEERAIQENSNSIAMPLRFVSPALYKAGCIAVSKLKKLNPRRPRGAIYQFFKRSAWLESQQLRSSKINMPVEGNSAELGLALALLMKAYNTRQKCALATGSLSNVVSNIEENGHDQLFICNNESTDQLKEDRAQDQKELSRDISSLQQQWDLLSDKWDQLNKQWIIETRAEEKFRLKHLIEETQIERDQIGQRLKILQSRLENTNDDTSANESVGLYEHQVQEGDIPVLPVNSISEEFQLVLQKAKENQFPEATPNKPLLFFTPVYFHKNDTWIEVSQLAEVETLQKYNIEVVPVTGVKEIAAKLQATKTRYLPGDWLAQMAVLILAIIISSWFLWQIWINSPIAMRFLSCDEDLFSDEPCRICSENGNVAVSLLKNTDTSLIPINSYIGWRVQIGDSASWDAIFANWSLFGWSMYDGYYVMAAILSDNSEVTPQDTLIGETGRLRVKPGENFEYQWRLNDIAENNILVIAATRYTPFDINHQFLQKLTSRGNIYNVFKAFREELPAESAIGFEFKTVHNSEDTQCEF